MNIEGRGLTLTLDGYAKKVIVQAGEYYLRYSSCDTAEVEAAGQDPCCDTAEVEAAGQDPCCATMAVEILPKWQIQ